MEAAGAGNEGIQMRRVLLHNYMDYLLNKTDIQENALQPLGISVSPNPVSNQVHISIPNEACSSKWKIYAKDGVLINEGESIQSSFTINCSSFASGSYHGVIEHGSRKSFISFIVSH
jgi:hypothetical protein